MGNRRLQCMVVLVAGLAAVTAAAQDLAPSNEGLEKAFPLRSAYSPFSNRNFPTQAFRDDTHLHTGMSMDAGAFGARLTPADACRFAKGQQVVSSIGQAVKLSRPLDWLVVADLVYALRSRKFEKAVIIDGGLLF